MTTLCSIDQPDRIQLLSPTNKHRLRSLDDKQCHTAIRCSVIKYIPVIVYTRLRTPYPEQLSHVATFTTLRPFHAEYTDASVNEAKLHGDDVYPAPDAYT